MRKLRQRSILKLYQSNHTTVTVCKRRPMVDVNKGAWPTEVKRSSEVNQHFVKDAPKLDHVKMPKLHIRQQLFVDGQPSVHMSLPCHLEVPSLLWGPAAERITQSDQNRADGCFSNTSVNYSSKTESMPLRLIYTTLTAESIKRQIWVLFKPSAV